MEKDLYVLTPREDDEESGENADFYTIESSPEKGSKGFKDTTAMFGNMEVDKKHRQDPNTGKPISSYFYFGKLAK